MAGRVREHHPGAAGRESEESPDTNHPLRQLHPNAPIATAMYQRHLQRRAAATNRTDDRLSEEGVSQDPVRAITAKSEHFDENLAGEFTARADQLEKDLNDFYARDAAAMDKVLAVLHDEVKSLTQLANDPEWAAKAERAMRYTQKRIDFFTQRRAVGPDSLSVTITEPGGQQTYFSMAVRDRATVLEKIQKIHGVERIYSEHSRKVLGVEIIGIGIEPAAIEKAAQYLEEAIGNNKFAQMNMSKQHVRVVIVPRAEAVYEHQLLGHNIKSSDALGLAFPDVDNRKTMLIPEEDLIQKQWIRRIFNRDQTSGSHLGVITTHELGHGLHLWGMSGEDQAKVTELYNKRKQTKGPWIDDYSEKNPMEYWGRCTEAYFGRNDSGRDMKWLEKNDPEVFRLLNELHSQKIDEQGNVEK